MASEARHDHKRKSQIGSGFFYSDLSASQFDPQMQSYEPNTELFNLQAAAGIEMLGPPQQHYSSHRDSNVRSSIPWRGFLDAKASSSKSIEPSGVDSYYHHPEYQKPDFSTGFTGANVPNENNILIAPAETTWPQETRLLVEDSLRCVFPCDANQRTSQGLSLSLSPNRPSEIGLQSFELRETNHLQVPSNFRDGFLGKGSDFHHQFLQEGPSFLLKNSKYLVPAQELLNEFCNLGTKENGYADGWSKSAKHHKSSQWEEGVSSRTQSLLSFDFLELQKRKAKLISMLEEVDRKYRQYCEQMKAVVASFEAVAGSGSAAVYSSSASKAMSRHFRCLRDGIVSQIKATRKAMGEKDPVAAPGTTKGETPRLRLLDQTLRQQRAFQQMGVMESHPWRPQRGLPERSVSVLRAWLFEHFLHPYPSDVDKHILARQTGLSRSQVSNWFINARVRLWKPMVEEMYLEETKEQAEKRAVAEADASNYSGQQQEMIMNGGRQDSIDEDENPNPSTLHLVHPRDHLDNYQDHDQKPTPEQLVLHHDSDSLSSIINNNSDHIRRLPLGGTKDQKQQQQPPPPQEAPHQHQNEFGIRPESNFGVVVDLDFSSYSHENSAVTYAGNSDGTFGGGGGGVSLTLGLQQHGEAAGVGLPSFSQGGGGGGGPQPGSLFFPRQHMVEAECGQPMQYSLLDGEPQNLPYRNLMAAQLLHDLAG